MNQYKATVDGTDFHIFAAATKALYFYNNVKWDIRLSEYDGTKVLKVTKTENGKISKNWRPFRNTNIEKYVINLATIKSITGVDIKSAIVQI